MRFKATDTKTPLLAAGLVAAAIAGASTAAAEVWRCGNSYSDRPCDDGQAVDVEDARSDDQRRDALQGMKANSATASDLERQRHRAHARQPAAVLIGSPTAHTTVKPKSRASRTTKASPKKGKGLSNGDFVASYPTPAEQKKKSRKATVPD